MEKNLSRAEKRKAIHATVKAVKKATVANLSKDIALTGAVKGSDYLDKNWLQNKHPELDGVDFSTVNYQQCHKTKTSLITWLRVRLKGLYLTFRKLMSRRVTSAK